MAKKKPALEGKTNPIGVRFNNKLLAELKRDGIADTPQQALNFLEDLYMAVKGLISVKNGVIDVSKFIHKDVATKVATNVATQSPKTKKQKNEKPATPKQFVATKSAAKEALKKPSNGVQGKKHPTESNYLLQRRAAKNKNKGDQ